jgi:hypothetical protein
MSNNQLALTEVMTVSRAFAESKMFADTKEAAQAFVKVQAGQELGISPFAAMTGIHVIVGKLILGSTLMAALIKASNKYNYKVLVMTEQECTLEFYEDCVISGQSKFTLEDARKAGTKNMEKYPRNMLFARALSNGAKWYCPEVFMGAVYVPEEVNDIPKEQVTVDAQPNQVVVDVPLIEPDEEQKERIIKAVTEEGYTIEQVKTKYLLNPGFEHALNIATGAIKIEVPTPVTQEMIKEANANYTPAATNGAKPF